MKNYEREFKELFNDCGLPAYESAEKYVQGIQKCTLTKSVPLKYTSYTIPKEQKSARPK